MSDDRDREGRSGNNRDGLRRLHGRRQAHKLKPRQAALMEDLGPAVSIGPVPGLDDAGPVLDPGRLDPSSLFGRGRGLRPLWLEIGYGGGEHLAWQAESHPDIDFIGAEPFLNGIAKMLVEIDDRNLKNVRLFNGDARDLLEALPDGCLDRAFLLHPDPWPKTRHFKRRFVQRATLNQLARLLKPGAQFRVASDIPSYVWWTLAHVMDHPDFVWTADRPADWRARPADWPQTRYEAKARREGRVPTYLIFERVADAGPAPLGGRAPGGDRRS